jgi:NAD(P)-dependent dehydrogenase (short-subunit alcohol dehydrogenase family)
MGNSAQQHRTVIVTGGSDGIGAAASRVLAGKGDHVVIVGRSPGKTRAFAAEIGAEYHVADFARLGQVRDLAAELKARHPRIDVLVNNAGLIAGPQRTVTADEHELTFQVNHLAPFLLTMLLKEGLTAARGRVITTSSEAGTRRSARVVLDDLDLADGYGAPRAYQASKLANILFTRELARRWGPLGVTAAAFHPGIVRTQWGRSGPLAVRLVMNSPFRLVMRSPSAARTRWSGCPRASPARTGPAAATSPTADQSPLTPPRTTRTWPGNCGTGQPSCAASSRPHRIRSGPRAGNGAACLKRLAACYGWQSPAAMATLRGHEGDSRR